MDDPARGRRPTAGGNLDRDVQRGLQRWAGASAAGWRSVCPSMYSIAMNGWPSAFHRAAYTTHTLGWLRAEAARASCSNRRIRAWSDATSPDSTLIATLRPSFASWARYTSPIPPAPSGPADFVALKLRSWGQRHRSVSGLYGGQVSP